MKPEIHLFIIWQRGRYKEAEILADMNEHFTMLKQYAITWTPELVSSNFTRFYGVNLPPKSGKEQHCGSGEFMLYIVRDENPVYAERMTSRGPEVVNTNMFDAKERYRSWTGGGHKVHGTNSEKETNHDLTLLIGKNVEDFLKENKDTHRETVKKDIEGAHGWESISHLFYVLNNTVSYVILRGISDNKDDSYLDSSDTDILTTDYQNMWFIINGEAVYHHVRPKAKIIVNNQMFYLDIWDTRKNYFDSLWVEQMYETSAFFHGMKILNQENDFYCLLYHCLTNKGYIADKYSKKLQAYREKFGIKENDWAKILVDWLSSNHYDIIAHTDPSNPFNISNPIIHEYALRFGKCIRVVKSTIKDVVTNAPISWISRVYKKNNSYVKAGTPWLIDNEARFLKKIGDGKHFPKLIASGGDDIEHWIEISEMPGRELFASKWGIRMQNIRKYALRILDLLEILYQNDIIHRDIHSNNIYVDNNDTISVLDFGFAIDFRNDKVFCCPWNLGMGLAPNYMYSDFYNLAKIFEYRWEKMPYVARFAKELKKIDWEHYKDAEFVMEQIGLAKVALNKNFSLLDIWEYLLGKYKVRKYIRHPKRLLRRIMPDMTMVKEYIIKLPRRVMRKTKKLLHL